jgi:uncharacterized linocin/CFP29 family protein
MKDLRRELAPITPRAWKMIENDARDILRANLTARRVADVDGPHGWEYSAVNLGRTESVDGRHAGAARLAARSVLPLVELRVDFSLDAEELRRVDRGATHIDLGPLEEACREMAAEEDRLVFEGLPDSGMEGLCAVALKGTMKDTPQEIAKSILRAVEQLRRRGVDGPYGVALGPDDYGRLAESVGDGGEPLLSYIEELVDCTVLRAVQLNGALVFRRGGGDWILTLGRDVSIGYIGHDAAQVNLYLQESLAFRAVDPQAAVHLTR